MKTRSLVQPAALAVLPAPLSGRTAAAFAAACLATLVAFGPAFATEPPHSPRSGAPFAAFEDEGLAELPGGLQTAPAPTPLGGPSLGEGIVLNFRDASLDAVLDYLSDAAGFAVVRNAEVGGRVTLTSRQPVSPEEAVDLLSTVLKDRGFAAVLTGRTLRILPLAEAKRTTIPVTAGNDPDAIAASDRLVTHVIPLRHVDAAQLKEDIEPLLPPHAELAANASSNALILTDTQANIQRIVRIVRALDTHMGNEEDVRVFALRYANASAAARLINEIFGDDQAAQQQGQPAASSARRSREQQTAARPAETRRHQRIQASADERTNTLVVSGPPDRLNAVERVVDDLDSNPEIEQAVFTYRLRNMKSENMAKTLNTLFNEMRSRQEASGSRGGRAPAPLQRPHTDGADPTREGERQETPGRPSSQANPDVRQGSTMYGSDLYVPPGLSGNPGNPGDEALEDLPPEIREAAAEIAGDVFVVPDPDTNSLMIMTASGNFERVRQMLEELDRPVPQVLIKVLLAEVTHTDSRDLGAEFSVLNLRASGRGERLFTDFGVEAARGGMQFRLVEQDLDIALRALEEAGKLDVLSRPYILASDNQPASITVGQRAPFIRSSRITEAGQTINTIEYEDIGIILRVTPHINHDGLVIMDVEPEISALTGDTVPITDTVSAPVFAKRAAESRVAIQDGQTIVIGGLMEDKLTENVRRVPILGQIPWIGALFRRTITESTKTELLIFMTPHVAEMASELEEMSRSEQDAIQAVPGAVREGAFQSHLDGMRRYPSGWPQAPKPE